MELEGLSVSPDQLALRTPVIHRRNFQENQLGYILDATLASIDPSARQLLDHAALMAPDHLIMDLLRNIVDQRSAALTIPIFSRGVA